MNTWIQKHKWKFATVISALAILFYFSLPKTLFSDPYSTVLEDKNKNLLSASIAADGQWRFPEEASVPDKFKEAIVLYEDKRFYNHLGVDPISIGRAIKQNISAGKIISGGSTLSMQVIRLARKNKSRTVFEKLIEVILATRLEFRYTKKEILALYASHAPFGGNVVGIEAACWRYFARPPDELSWAEAALLAVLPNNPSLIHLGKNRIRLKEKRDRLLTRLSQDGKFDSLALDLARAEPVPENPIALPRMATHLLDRASKEGKAQQKIISTIDGSLQQRVQQILNDHHQRLRANQIFNAATIVVEVKTGNVLAYIGNVEAGRENHEQVDVANAPRSTGSILKPFLFAAMLDDGKMLSKTLQPDIPIIINGFAPKNFSNEHDGAVPADKALIRSLNIPAVEELRDFRYEKFYELLKNIGVTTLNNPSDHYGLSLILGGAEGTLWDITGVYASMARTLNNYFTHPGKDRYDKSDFHPLRYSVTSYQLLETGNWKPETTNSVSASSWLSASSIYLTFDALKELYRPGEETGWKYFSSSKKIAWKTGTSHGLRDGWAVGVNAEYAVGVWVGNADGEGRPGLTGTETAAPILFDLFSLLPGNAWFKPPTSEMEKIPVCTKSGYRISELCEAADTIWVTKVGLQTTACPYHKKIHLSKDKKFRVHTECESLANMTSASWFVLPPLQEYYYKSKNNAYQSIPPYRKDCASPSTLVPMDLIYPKPDSKIFIPRELEGNASSTVFEAAHQNPSAIIYWHLDGEFVGATSKSHRIAINPTLGNHVLTLVDGTGEVVKRQFQILSKK
ncbi:MAG: penicillin-binding protein 1C [Cyclobacteriaceae bacterium]